jgi:signal peptidase I
MRGFTKVFLEVFEAALIAIGLVFLFRTFVAEPFLVGGLSMAPTFHDGDFVFVDRITYFFREPTRGETVVFHYPKGGPDYFLIKRVVGLPGERVKVADGTVTVFNSEHPEGIALEEEYLRDGTLTTGEADITLGDGQYFVLGDNRQVSFDSRAWGMLERKEIVGAARMRVWPPESMRTFAAPEY